MNEYNAINGVTAGIKMRRHGKVEGEGGGGGFDCGCKIIQNLNLQPLLSVLDPHINANWYSMVASWNDLS